MAHRSSRAARSRARKTPSPRQPSTDPLVLRSAAQYKALAHPIRHRIINLLRQRPATLRELAEAMAVSKGTTAYHVHVLRNTGLVEVTAARRVRGGTEQLLTLSSRAFRLDGRSGDSARFLVESALAEMVPAQAHEPEHTVLRHLWLTGAQAAAIAADLEQYTVPEGSPHDPDTQAYGLLLSLFPAAIPKLAAPPEP